MKKHIVFILIVAVCSLIVVLCIKYFNILSDIWLWLVGLAGSIIAGGELLFSKISDSVQGIVQKLDTPQKNVVTKPPLAQKTEIQQPKVAITNDVTDNTKMLDITVLRYVDDGETTLGLLFIDKKFYCYTLEDSFHEVKVSGKTRIPAGTYIVDFIKEVTPLTQTYRNAFPWFTYHLEIKNVPGFTGVYIHNGGTSDHTQGCLLVADGIFANDQKKMLQNSVNTYTRLYAFISNILSDNYTITLKILNENWIQLLNTN